MTLIAFVGSVFSPYYAWARRGGDADPQNHCALNVALYSRRAARWSMTERGTRQVERTSTTFALGRSSLRWNAGALDVDVDEVCAPIPQRVRGSIRLVPTALSAQRFALDAAGLHQWTPFAPCAHVDVRLTEPALSWSGVAYLDSNFGAEPVENAFKEWTWSRASLPGSTVVLYDVTPRRQPAHSLALKFASDGSVEHIAPPPDIALPRTGWRVARRTRADAGADGAPAARVLRTLEDAPFYSRSLLETRLLGVTAPAIHESLDLNRFRRPWVQAMLPFRMPRRIF